MAKRAGIPVAWMPSLVRLPSAEISAVTTLSYSGKHRGVSDIKFVDFTNSYKAMLRYI